MESNFINVGQTHIFSLMKTAHIISIGNELLIGDTLNTNAAWIGRYLSGMGFNVEQIITLPDSYDSIRSCLERSFRHANVTIVTGGLGPTHDDITKQVVADLFKSRLVEDAEVLNHIKKIFDKRDFKFSRSNAEQALIPHNCAVLFNQKGTAPGLWYEKNNHTVAVLPGVPHEMKYLMEDKVSEKLKSTFLDLRAKRIEYFHTAGVPESTLSDDVVGDLDEYLGPNVEIAYLPNPGGVTIRWSSLDLETENGDRALEKFRKMLYEKAGDVIFSEGKDRDLSAVTGKLLADGGLSISVAESCTGGRLGDVITNVPGSSQYMYGGLIAYSNHLKMEHLDVPQEDLLTFGAVSKQVALQMAKAATQKFGSSIGVSTTGVAGPGGGTREKPVGTVWMGFWFKDKHFALKAIFTEDREINKQRTAMVVLETIRRQLLGVKSFPYNLTPVYS